MKRRTKRRHPSKQHPERRPAPSGDRRLILINDAPLRKRAAADCKRELAKLDKARVEWQRFEQKDQPAFARWTAVTFGPLLTELRENENLLEEQETFIEEVEAQMVWGDEPDPQKVYQAVKKEWDSPDLADDFANADDSAAAEDGRSHPADGRKDELTEEARRALFDEFLRSNGGADPRRIPKAVYEGMFAEFQRSIFEEEEENTTNQPARPRDEKKPAPVAEGARLKGIYRILVRRLHPDLRASADATVSLLWHEVQEAYQAQNLERLETLLALTQMQDGTEAGQASLSQMRGAVEELRRSLRSLQRSINGARSEPGWAFSHTQNHDTLEKKMRRELELTLSRQRKALAEQRSILDDWSQPLHSPRKRSGKKRGTEIPRAVQADLFAF